MTSLVLASASPFRRMLLQNAGLAFDTHAATIDERAIEERLREMHDSPEHVAVELAKAKALDVSRQFPGMLVLGSDQTMSLGERVFHKPADLEEARSHIG